MADTQTAQEQMEALKEKALVVKEKSKSFEELLRASHEQIKNALPKHMDVDRIKRIALTTFRMNPKLAQCDPITIIAALMMSAQLGLEPNINGQAYIAPFHNSKDVGGGKSIKVMEAQFIIGFQGYIDLFYRHHLAKTIDTHAVYTNDFYDAQYGTDSYLHHKPADKDRGEAYKYYAVATLLTGGSVFKEMSKEACIEHGKKHSKCWDKRGGMFKPFTPWATEPDAMSKKTVILQLQKMLPKSVEINRALSLDGTVKREISEQMYEVPDVANWGDENEQEAA